MKAGRGRHVCIVHDANSIDVASVRQLDEMHDQVDIPQARASTDVEIHENGLQKTCPNAKTCAFCKVYY